MEEQNNKFSQISSIFFKFSEENKDKLLETARGLLKIQMEEAVLISNKNEGALPPK